jgi:hypothetical protein
MIALTACATRGASFIRPSRHCGGEGGGACRRHRRGYTATRAVYGCRVAGLPGCAGCAGSAGCVVASVSYPGGTMSNELLPAPDVLAEPRRDADSAAAEIIAACRDGGDLTEYAGPRPDAQKLVDTIARFEAAMLEPLHELPAAVSGGLPILLRPSNG